MLIRSPTDILPGITSGDAYLHRREWLKQAASMGLPAGLPVLACDAQAQGLRLAGVKANRPTHRPMKRSTRLKTSATTATSTNSAPTRLIRR